MAMTHNLTYTPTGFDIVTQKIEACTNKSNPKAINAVPLEDVGGGAGVMEKEKQVSAALSNFPRTINSNCKRACGKSVKKNLSASAATNSSDVSHQSKRRKNNIADSTPSSDVSASPFSFGTSPISTFNSTYSAKSIIPPHKSINRSSQTLFTKRLLPIQIACLNKRQES